MVPLPGQNSNHGFETAFRTWCPYRIKHPSLIFETSFRTWCSYRIKHPSLIFETSFRTWCPYRFTNQTRDSKLKLRTWCSHPESNWGPLPYQGSALPPELCEPYLERVAGIEPAQPAWKAGVLPLNYTRRVCSALLLHAVTIWWRGVDLNHRSFRVRFTV